MENDLVSNKKCSHLKKHPYCSVCGAVKSLKIDRARPLGFYTNLLRDIRSYLERQNKLTGGIVPKLTTPQMRLIIKELHEHPDFEDDFIRNRTEQIRMFVEVLRKYRPDLQEGLIMEIIEA